MSPLVIQIPVGVGGYVRIEVDTLTLSERDHQFLVGLIAEMTGFFECAMKPRRESASLSLDGEKQ